jgi:hypothetical protein
LSSSFGLTSFVLLQLKEVFAQKIEALAESKTSSLETEEAEILI